MAKQLARLVVVQVLLIIYAVLAAGMFLKCNDALSYGMPLPSSANYCDGIRRFGIWLLLIPAGWSAVCFWQQRKPASDASTFVHLYISGIVVAGFLFAVALRTSFAFYQVFQ